MIILLGAIMYILIGSFFVGFIGLDDYEVDCAYIFVVFWPLILIVGFIMLIYMKASKYGAYLHIWINRKFKKEK